MKIPALFKNEDLMANAMKKSFASEAGSSSSVFFEWKDPTPVEVTFHAKKDSTLECVFIQNLDATTELPAQVRIIADRGATVRCTLIHQGGAKSQIALDSTCAEEGSSIQVQALANSARNQKHAFIAHSNHPVPHTNSDLKVWCVAKDESQTIFSGKITIEKGAHHTEALQKNKNLILSEKATVDSIPQLFIFNDDVKCAHGSSTSTLDPDQYIYLQSRGIGLQDAEAMITRGFIENAIHWIENSEASARVHAVLGLQQEEVL